MIEIDHGDNDDIGEPFNVKKIEEREVMKEEGNYLPRWER